MTIGLIILGVLVFLLICLRYAIFVERCDKEKYQIGYDAMRKRLALLTAGGVEYDPNAVAEARISITMEFLENKAMSESVLRGIDDAIYAYEQEWGAP